MITLSQAQLAELKGKLCKLQADLGEQLQMSEGAAATVTLDQTLVGRVSRMDAIQQQSMAQSTRGKVQQRLQRVVLALKAMDVGDYGYCRQCNEEIAYQRLQAQPEAALCIHCQNRADQQ